MLNYFFFISLLFLSSVSFAYNSQVNKQKNLKYGIQKYLSYEKNQFGFFKRIYHSNFYNFSQSYEENRQHFNVSNNRTFNRILVRDDCAERGLKLIFDSNFESLNQIQNELEYNSNLRFDCKLFINQGEESHIKKTDDEIVKQLPKTNVQVEVLDKSTREFNFILNASDYDGYIIRSVLSVSNSYGIIEKHETAEQIKLSLPYAGTYQISYRIQNNRGHWYEYKGEYEVVNVAPKAALEVTRISPNRLYFFTENSNDLDGNVNRFAIKLLGPNGESLSLNKRYGNFDIKLDSSGIWKILYGVIDNEGAWSEIEEKKVYIAASNESLIFSHQKSNTFSTIFDVFDSNLSKVSDFGKAGSLRFYEIEGVSYRRPKADFYIDGIVSEGLDTIGEIRFNAVKSSSKEGKIISYNWYIDNNPVSSQHSFDHVFERLGEHVIKLVIKSEYGKQDVKEVIVNVLKIVDPATVESRAKISLEGVLLYDINPETLNVALTISDGFEFASGISVYLNESNVTSKFELSKKNLTSNLSLESGYNELSIHGFDQNGNLLRSYYSFFASHTTKKIRLVDADGKFLPNVKIDANFGGLKLNDLDFVSDSNGHIIVPVLSGIDYYLSSYFKNDVLLRTVKDISKVNQLKYRRYKFLKADGFNEFEESEWNVENLYHSFDDDRFNVYGVKGDKGIITIGLLNIGNRGFYQTSYTAEVIPEDAYIVVSFFNINSGDFSFMDFRGYHFHEINYTLSNYFLSVGEKEKFVYQVEFFKSTI